jgi:hypothetical protein
VREVKRTLLIMDKFKIFSKFEKKIKILINCRLEYPYKYSAKCWSKLKNCGEREREREREGGGIVIFLKKIKVLVNHPVI